MSLEVDVTNIEHVNNMFKATLDRYGKIDILVNNAARNVWSPVVEMTEETWHVVIDTCLNGTFYCTRAVLPHMVRQGSGKIVSMASVAGWDAAPNQAHMPQPKPGLWHSPGSWLLKWASTESESMPWPQAPLPTLSWRVYTLRKT